MTTSFLKATTLFACFAIATYSINSFAADEHAAENAAEQAPAHEAADAHGEDHGTAQQPGHGDSHGGGHGHGADTPAAKKLQSKLIPPHKEKKPLREANRYSGGTAIELKNGIPFNNGTYGKPNPNYEQWATAPLVEPGLSEKPYPYAAKADFIQGCEESAQFISHAIWNWKRTVREEIKPFANESIKTVEPMLEKLRSAIKTAKGANESNWENAQAEARRAVVEIRGTYATFHKNVNMK